jgi:Tfp pilus assembly protein PilV
MLRKAEGLSLVEVIVAVALLSLILIPLVGVFPTSYMSIKKAEDYQTAASYAQALIQEVQADPPDLDTLDQQVDRFEVVLNGTAYLVTRGIYAVDTPREGRPHKLVDVAVHLAWKRIPESLLVTSRLVFNQ